MCGAMMAERTQKEFYVKVKKRDANKRLRIVRRVREGKFIYDQKRLTRESTIPFLLAIRCRKTSLTR